MFVDADYSQIELRILAHMSGDERLIEAYRDAQDIHAITASEVFHMPLNEVTPLQRRNAKGSKLWYCVRNQCIWPERGSEYLPKRGGGIYQ